MFSWLWKIAVVLLIAAGLFFFQFSLDQGELVIRLRGSDEREHLSHRARSAAETARELAGKVRYEGAQPKADKEPIKEKGAVTKARELPESLDDHDRKQLEDVIAKELK